MHLIRFAGIAFFLCHTTLALFSLAEDRIHFDFDQQEQPFQLHTRSTSEGYRLSLHDLELDAGQYCLALKAPAGRPPGFNQIGKVIWKTDATPYRGKRIRWSAQVRLLSDPLPQRWAALWASSIRPGFLPGAWSDLGGHPARGNQWQRIEVVLDIEPDAAEVEIGFLLGGHQAEAHFDAGVLEVIGVAYEGNVPPRPIDDQGVRNLVALAKMMGAVRYFHPSNEAAQVDWDRWLHQAIEFVEPATDAEDLADRLQALFNPLVLDLHLWHEGTDVAKYVPSYPTDEERPRVSYRHIGVGTNASLGFFKSERLCSSPASSQGIPVTNEILPLPPNLCEVDLGCGVMLRFPTVLTLDAAGRLPQPTSDRTLQKLAASFPMTGFDRTTRLAAVMIGWAKMHWFFPYFDVVQCDWEGGLVTALHKASTDRDPVEFQVTLESLWSLLADSHTVVKGGSGTGLVNAAMPLSWDIVEDQLVVTWVREDWRARIKPGDVVTAIDDNDALELFQSLLARMCGASVQSRRHRVCQELRNGTEGVSRRLKLVRSENEVVEVEVPLEEADATPLRGPSMREPRLPIVAELEPGYVYVDLDRFQFAELNKLSRNLSQAKGLIVDLRGYPSAEATALFAMLGNEPHWTDQFLTPVTVGPNLSVDRQLLPAPGDGTWPRSSHRITCPMVFLTDGRAVSAAESLLGIAKNAELGPIIGEATAGSNGGVNLHYLPGGYRVSWTNHVTRKRDGGVFHGIGVTPDEEIRHTIESLRQGRDLVVEKGLERLKSK